MMLVGFFSILFQTLIWFIRTNTDYQIEMVAFCTTCLQPAISVQEVGWLPIGIVFSALSDANETVAYILDTERSC